MNDINVLIKRKFLIDKKPVSQISEEMDISEGYISKITKRLKPPKRSSGELAMVDILGQIYPSHKIEEQTFFHGQFLDFYIPKIRLAFEYDGIQHAMQNDLYHGKGTMGAYKFENGIAADKKKDKFAKKERIYLIRIPHTTKLSEETIRGIINEHSHKIVANLADYNSGIRL